MAKLLSVFLALILSVLLGGCHARGSTIYGDDSVSTGQESPEIRIQVTGLDERLDMQPIPPKMGFPFIHYPYEMRRAGITGSVLVRLEIDPAGQVSNVTLVEATYRDFAAEVMANAAKCRFLPGKKDGRPTACSIVCKFSFELHDD